MRTREAPDWTAANRYVKRWAYQIANFLTLARF